MRAILLLDIQNDFLTGGALAVPRGEEVIPIANHLTRAFEIVVATQDWHPAGHSSFAASHQDNEVGDIIELEGLQQVLWPVHCVQETYGAAFADDLDTDRLTCVFAKGTEPTIDSYSGFFDNARRHSTGLSEYLRNQGVDSVCIAGLATDYCVKATALDAQEQGFKTIVVSDGCRGVELSPGDVERAITEMEAAGIVFQTSQTITAALSEAKEATNL